MKLITMYGPDQNVQVEPGHVDTWQRKGYSTTPPEGKEDPEKESPKNTRKINVKELEK